MKPFLSRLFTSLDKTKLNYFYVGEFVLLIKSYKGQRQYQDDVKHTDSHLNFFCKKRTEKVS